MDTIEIRPINLIRDPNLLNQTTVEMLRKQLLRYPYYQSLRLLLLENLYLIHDPQFKNCADQLPCWPIEVYSSILLKVRTTKLSLKP